VRPVSPSIRRRASTVVLVGVAMLVALGVTACSSAPPTPARARFVERLQQAGPKRFDQVQVGDDKPLDAATAECVAKAFEKNRWAFDAALDGRVPTQVDVKAVNKAVAGCLQDPGTTTIGPFGRAALVVGPT
jgi:hypothetical protein